MSRFCFVQAHHVTRTHKASSHDRGIRPHGVRSRASHRRNSIQRRSRSGRHRHTAYSGHSLARVWPPLLHYSSTPQLLHYSAHSLARALLLHTCFELPLGPLCITPAAARTGIHAMNQVQPITSFPTCIMMTHVLGTASMHERMKSHAISEPSVRRYDLRPWCGAICICDACKDASGGSSAARTCRRAVQTATDAHAVLQASVCRPPRGTRLQRSGRNQSRKRSGATRT